MKKLAMAYIAMLNYQRDIIIIITISIINKSQIP